MFSYILSLSNPPIYFLYFSLPVTFTGLFSLPPPKNTAALWARNLVCCDFFFFLYAFLWLWARLDLLCYLLRGITQPFTHNISEIRLEWMGKRHGGGGSLVEKGMSVVKCWSSSQHARVTMRMLENCELFASSRGRIRSFSHQKNIAQDPEVLGMHAKSLFLSQLRRDGE